MPTRGRARASLHWLGTSIERLTVFNGKTPVAVRRPYGAAELGRRIRVVWEGAKYRGRGREIFWRGLIRLDGNRFKRASWRSISSMSTSRCGSRPTAPSVAFDTVTTGNFAGYRPLARQRRMPASSSSSPMSSRHGFRSPTSASRTAYFAGGGLGVATAPFRLPDEIRSRERGRDVRQSRCSAGRDNPLYVRADPGGRAPGLVEPDLRHRRKLGGGARRYRPGDRAGSHLPRTSSSPASAWLWAWSSGRCRGSMPASPSGC